MIRKLRQRKARNEKGFTLIELMIVVAIIGILAAIAIPQFSAYRERSYIASMKADCNAVRTAEEAYFVDNDKYLVIAVTAEGVAPADLATYGIKAISAGNKVAVAASTDINKDFKVTVTSTKTTKTTVYDSPLGTTVTN